MSILILILVLLLRLIRIQLLLLLIIIIVILTLSCVGVVVSRALRRLAQCLAPVSSRRRLHIDVCIYIYIYMHMCIYVCRERGVCIYIYIYTHIYIYICIRLFNRQWLAGFQLVWPGDEPGRADLWPRYDTSTDNPLGGTLCKHFAFLSLDCVFRCSM